MNRCHSPLLRLLAVAIVATLASHSDAQQRIRFPSGSNSFFPGQAPQLPTGILAQAPTGPTLGMPQPYTGPTNGPGSVTPWTPIPGGPPANAALGGQIQQFDPYGVPDTIRGPSAVIPNQPAFPPVGAFPPSGTFPPTGSFPPPNLPTITTPNVNPNQNLPVFPSGPPQVSPPAANVPPFIPPAPNYSQGGGFGPPPPINGSLGGVNSGSGWGWGQPVQPAPIFPNGINWGSGRITRLFQDTGALYTYIYGEDSNELQMHEVEVFTSAIFKEFLGSASDLRLTPGFAFHFLDGPAGAGRIDLPKTLYSAYLNALWQPQLTPQFGIDFNFRAGVYSDFDAVNSDSVRFTGRGLGVLQVTPNLAFKLGAEYLDRNRVKILPAGGFLWQPDQQTLVDIYFPRPMVSRYWRTVGNTEYWWHIGAEYGGGAWTIEDGGIDEQIDINDIRIFAGFDWNRLDRLDGIFEIGWVFDREVVTVKDPTLGLDIEDSFMIRAGVKY